MDLVVITAGSSNPSSTKLLGDRLADATVDALGAAGHPASVTHLELRELASDLANAYVTHLPSARLREAFDAAGRRPGSSSSRRR